MDRWLLDDRLDPIAVMGSQATCGAQGRYPVNSVSRCFWVIRRGPFRILGRKHIKHLDLGEERSFNRLHGFKLWDFLPIGKEDERERFLTRKK